MLRLSEIKLPLDHSSEAIKDQILKRLDVSDSQLITYRILKRSIDARSNDQIKFIYSIEVSVKDEKALLRRLPRKKNVSKAKEIHYKYVAKAREDFFCNNKVRPVVVGAGPCGYFAALLLAQMGFRPLLLERGKQVKLRTLETFGFWRGKRSFDPGSNVQFGEGGAGTFSDGKLYSQVSDPQHYGRKVLEELVASGANPEILTNHRPHIGTYKLATVVRGLRSRIEKLGGEILFERKMEELILKKSIPDVGEGKPFEVEGIKLSDGSFVKTDNLILALGHSARDTFAMLERVGVHLEPKLFSIGFRVEHPQAIVDNAQWGGMAGHPKLGHAEYKLVHHASNGRCVYTFCMCPGGLVVGSASEEGGVVTNGMSQHSRNERNANSALVVDVWKEDLADYERWSGDPLAGVFFQQALERRAFELGGNNYFAPVQRIEDFLMLRPSEFLGSVQPSYLPGITLADLNQSLPPPFIEAIKESLPVFGRRFKPFSYPDAVITAIETRTSSPIRIPRDSSMESINIKGLIPAGEGAGYAGGILSAGIDGIRAAEALATRMTGDSSSLLR